MAERAAQTPNPIDLPQRIPRHVGIIMDGNGRWAQLRKMPREKGHSQGAEAVRKIVRYSRRIGIEGLSLYAFSAQNWDRPPQEVFHLMELLRRFLIEERGEILDNNIRLTTIGDVQRLPSLVKEPLADLIAASEGNDGMTLCLALSYGGREAIVKTAREMARQAVEGKLDPESIDVPTFESYLPTSSKLPPLDLLIRTSGERRISNFFLWEVAYAELYFCPTLWPDYDEKAFREALDSFAKRERRFGLTGEQIRSEATGEKEKASASLPLEVSVQNREL